MATIPTTEPLEIIAGDTLSWKKTLLDYPASQGWTLKYRFINAVALFDIVSVASGDDQMVNVAAATTAAYPPGIYSWQSYVTNVAGERHTIQEGNISVQANWAAQVVGLETRSTAKQILDALEAAWLVASTKRAYVFEYRIGAGSSMRLMRFGTRQEWILEINYWRRMVAQEEAAAKIAAGQDSGRKLYVRF
jgi:hypothetical protein